MPNHLTATATCEADNPALDLWDDDYESMNWTRLQYTRADINRAGKALLTPPVWAHDREDVLAKVDNWRSAHNYPLHALTMSLRLRARSIDQETLIAQRLKRLGSITAKLERHPNMKLSQMQDIGGCRAVVKDILCLNALVTTFERGRSNCWRLQEKYDYVQHPKPDGYRSVHLVYRYGSKSHERTGYDNMRIEVQLRSRLQHAWATALETVDTFTRQALKANKGDPSWHRFFVLMSHSIALREGQRPVPEAPPSRTQLIEEIKYLATSLNVESTLAGWTAAIKHTQQKRQGHFFLLTLDFGSRRMSIVPFRKSESELAAEQYALAEKANLENHDVHTVLVSVDSLDALRIAYPNYYLDTSAFVRLLKEDIDC